MKHYMDIVRLGHKTTVGVLNEGDQIVIQEKIDGANASFLVDENGEIQAFSRRTQLDENSNLGGFYNFAKALDPTQLLKGMIYFGEWLNPHKVKYPEKTFYLYDIYNIENEKYMDFEYVENAAKRLNLNLVPIFYKGDYKSFEHLEQFIGKTMIGGKIGDKEMGEGIVVKNVNYTDRFGNQMFVKLVAEEFQEVQKQKAAKDLNHTISQEQQFVNAYVPKARVEKFLHKFVDEGVLDSNWGIEDMGIILKNMNQQVFEDLLKEESDYLPQEYDEKELRKSINRVLPSFVKEIAKEKERQVA